MTDDPVFKKVLSLNGSRYVPIPAKWKDIIDHGDPVKLTRSGKDIIVERVGE